MAALTKMFGGKKGEPPTPQTAIQKLRETEEMLSKKTEFLEKRIEKELAAAKKNGMKNKRGVFSIKVLPSPSLYVNCRLTHKLSIHMNNFQTCLV